jgi:hypothetical protein
MHIENIDLKILQKNDILSKYDINIVYIQENKKIQTKIDAYKTKVQELKDEKMLELNPVKVETLEEEIVYKMAPIGVSDSSTYIETSYKPIADPLFCNGSMC